MKADRDRIAVYVVLRALLTLLVVIGHCAYYTIMTAYGGIDWEGAMLSAGVSDALAHRIATMVTYAILTFHMSMFFALSGAIFEYKQKKSYAATLSDKAKRLLIPFIVVTTIASVPLKAIAGYWSDSSNPMRDIVVGQYLMQGNTHLWFLPTLFMGFLFFAPIWKYERNSRALSCVLFLAGICGFIGSLYIRISLISGFLRYFLWFYTGVLFERKRKVWDSHFNVRTMLLSLAIWIGLGFVKLSISDAWMESSPAMAVLSMALAYSGMVFFYALCNVLSKTPASNWRAIERIERHSFGIYLFSDPLNYVILSAFVYLFTVKAFGSELAATLLFVSRFVITLLVSLLISVGLEKLNAAAQRRTG